MELRNECCSFVIFAGRSPVSEGVTDSDDLFNLFDVRVATVNVVMNSHDGSEEGLVGDDDVGEWDGVSSSAEQRWCLNGGTSTWNCWCGWWYVFLVRVIELAGGRFVWVREADTSDVGGSIFTDSEESCNPLLDICVLLLYAYWTFGSI